MIWSCIVGSLNASNLTLRPFNLCIFKNDWLTLNLSRLGNARLNGSNDCLGDAEVMAVIGPLVKNNIATKAIP